MSLQYVTIAILYNLSNKVRFSSYILFCILSSLMRNAELKELRFFFSLSRRFSHKTFDTEQSIINMTTKSLYFLIISHSVLCLVDNKKVTVLFVSSCYILQESVLHLLNSVDKDTWVQCDKCSKWRRLTHICDPATLPDRWYCTLLPGMCMRDLFLYYAQLTIVLHVTAING